MPQIGTVEIIVIAVLLLVFLGAKRLPIFGKGLGQAKSEFKKGLTEDSKPSSAAKK